MANPSSGFTGRQRAKRTNFRVRAADVISRFMITVGGIGTIVAVTGVFLFLVWVVLPLVSSPTITDVKELTSPPIAGAPLRLATDEYQIMGYVVTTEGELLVFRLDTGEIILEQALFEGSKLTAHSFSSGDESVAFGFEDGTVRTGSIRFATRYLEEADVPDHVRAVTAGEFVAYGGGMVERTSENQLRMQVVVSEFDDAIDIGEGKAILLLDRITTARGLVFGALTSDDALSLYSVTSRRNLMTGKTTYRVRRGDLPYDPGSHGRPAYLELSGLGDNVFIAWPDGHLLRYDTRDINKPVVAEQLDLVQSPTAKLTSLRFMLGNQTLIAGDSEGRLAAWFGIKPEHAATVDGIVLREAHHLATGSAGVKAVHSSQRSRTIVVGFADGSIRMYQVTTEQLLAEVKAGATLSGIDAVAVAPKDDGFAAIGGGKMAAWKMDPKHPEASLTSIFRPVWYEGYAEPQHTWQSSSGDDAFEPKLGLFPLVFGTIKATIYSMIFAVPLALLAAVYTSEFLHPKIKARVKPLVEMMASLPSVVLGFLAGLVFAPVVERWLPGILASFVTIPFMFLLGAHLWQMLPRRRQILLQTVGIDDNATYTEATVASKFFQRIVFRLGGVRLMSLLILLCLGVVMATVVGGLFESLLFAGNIKLWMDGQAGSGVGGWFLILLPISAVMVTIGIGRWVNPYMRDISGEWSHAKFAAADLIKFLVACAAAIVLAVILGAILNTLGWDPRGPAHLGSVDVSLFGTYIQRNALIVGFVMGFAVIPIIYTIAEDALSAVPDHLRSASLGAGATPWQTAVRIIIPTAMSGLFSAIMIGLGRAVGETMIVLMAAGNTPVMNMNLFSGFRTLSANIAVELPEAVRDSTHYRTLFLAALTLFVMTFIVNTFAEIVRLRFRKKAVNL